MLSVKFGLIALEVWAKVPKRYRHASVTPAKKLTLPVTALPSESFSSPVSSILPLAIGADELGVCAGKGFAPEGADILETSS
jgi:hypothetical protein